MLINIIMNNYFYRAILGMGVWGVGGDELIKSMQGIHPARPEEPVGRLEGFEWVKTL
jgi:hypothetical protein